MEATITEMHEGAAGTHEPIGFGGAFVREFRFLWTSRRPLLLLVALLAVLVLAGPPWSQDEKMRLLLVWPVWLIFIGPVWAFAVFHNEGPGSRLYFWSQPVDRATNTLARLTAGVAWLWIVFAALILFGWVLGLMDGNAWQLGEIHAAGWINFFTGPLLGYLVVSILTVPSDYPIRWFFGIIFLFPLLISVFIEWLEMEDAVETVLQPLIDEGWGLGVTMIGGLGHAVTQLDHTLRSMRDPTYSGSTHLNLELWWAATPLWILAIAAIVAFIATRHPDTLPKVRWFRLRS